MSAAHANKNYCFRSVALALLVAASAGHSEEPKLLPPSYQAPPADPGFIAPKISEDYARKLMQLPDWNGSWVLLGGYLFDPLNAWIPPNDDEAFDTGPLEGSVVKNIPYKPRYQKAYGGEVHLMERMRMIGPDLLEDQITIEDPVMLTRPWKVTRHLRRVSSRQAHRSR